MKEATSIFGSQSGLAASSHRAPEDVVQRTSTSMRHCAFEGAGVGGVGVVCVGGPGLESIGNPGGSPSSQLLYFTSTSEPAEVNRTITRMMLLYSISNLETPLTPAGGTASVISGVPAWPAGEPSA